eukprot:TRINITY_DN25220_c0_g1_i1.p1 TRINITY_DN25220_c0_g1~~TRINITY_DN25220_c0_g1_i1.p1  ORF type:complete len:215 (-),score=46.94 TRINITY_DN25220_c0_g1_i1:34-678(-)
MITLLNQNKQFDKNLIDEEGFPRADLEFGELANYRVLKRNIRELKNDHVKLMKEIEQGLYGLHEIYRNSGEAQQELEQYETNLEKKQKQMQIEEEKSKHIEQQQQKEILMPFAEINEVTQDSPSSCSGIKVNDLIVKFGQINYYNNDNLQNLASFVKSSENQDLEIILLRSSVEKEIECYEFQGKNYEKIIVSLKPQKWNGMGLLGCRFKPIGK